MASTVSSRFSRAADRINLQSFFAGVTFMIGLIFSGIYIQNKVSVAAESVTPLTSAFFIGLGVGHHMGKTVQVKENALTSAYLGAFLTLAVMILYYARLELISGVLVVMAITVFLAHSSGLVDNYANIRRSVHFVAGDIPIFGLSGLGLVRYIVPYALFLGTPSRYVQWTSNPIIVTLLLVVLITLAEYYRMRKSAVKIAEYANFMYELGREHSEENSE